MQIGEVGRRSRRPVERLHVGGQLHEIARTEPGREPKPPHQDHQQPRRVAATAARQGQRLLGLLNARLHADDIPHPLPHRAVERHEHVDRPHLPGHTAAVVRQAFVAEEGGEKLVDERAA